MAKIAFLLMVHKDPARVVEQARALTTHGDCVAIHADARMAPKDFKEIRDGLVDTNGISFAPRVRCGWGEWSLVQASLNLIEAARSAFDGITHYFLISGDCCPTKSRGYIDRFLSDGRDHIEVNDFFESDWIKTGMRADRLVYRHLVNERKYKRVFYALLNTQRALGWRRALPKGVRVHIGSQWWVLRASTIEKMMAFLKRRKDLKRFFRTTWIPDETFFQTLVARTVPMGEIVSAPPTTLLFSDYGMPVVFYGDHREYLRGQPQPFARKISVHATDMQRQLLAGFASWDAERPEGGAKTNIYGYLTARGRNGQRYAPRFWERAIEPNPSSEVLIICAKIWHLGHAIERLVADAMGITRLGYLFDEDNDLPVDIGNLEHGLFKRNQHRQALLNQVLRATGQTKVVVSVDPARADVVADITSFAGQMRLLMVERPLTEGQVRFHAERTGLIHPNSGPFERSEILRALTYEFAASDAQLRAKYKGQVFVNALDRSRDDNATDLGHFLRVPRSRADLLAREIEKFTN